ncbi:hypothetical protein ACMA5I_11245 [Paracoccaceae bacterium GXU_MW_L88]
MVASLMADYTLLCVAQSGRLAYEALIFMASLRAVSDRPVVIAEPQPGPEWDEDPRLPPEIRAELEEMGAEIRPFTAAPFGARYPYGNKIRALSVVEGPFLFLDTDTLFLTDPAKLDIDFTRPSASMRREGTWPKPVAYSYSEIWGALYRKFDLDFVSSINPRYGSEDWRRYLYFNAGWFYGPSGAVFGALMEDYATAIESTPPEEIAEQALYPWLDQIVLPLVIHKLGGGRSGPEGLDGNVTCHYRTLPLLYAREWDEVVEVLERVTAPNRIKKLLKAWPPAHQMIYRGKGAEVRRLFAGGLPEEEQSIRKRIKAAGLWMR